MVTIASLWLPILLSAVVVYIASSLVHMVMPWHKGDYRALPDEERALESLRQLQLQDGNYHAPHAVSAANTKDPAFKQKLQQGPLVFLYIRRGGSVAMGPMLGQWFVYTLLIAALCAYLCSHALAAGASYLTVFRISGFGAFLAYAGAQPIDSIWFFRNWSTSLKNVFDGLIYALLTGGVFGWLWPR